MIWEELNEKLIFPALDADTTEDIFNSVGGAAIREGYAKESYIQALIQREAEYPTGLNVDDIGVAIPHTPVDHVNKSGIAIAVLNKPVTFVEMGTDDDTVPVQLVFMLCVVDPNQHIDELQRILDIIQDSNVLSALLKAHTAAEIINIVKEKELAL